MADPYEETNLLRRSPGGKERERLLADLFMRHRERLRLMVDLRLDPRLRGRIDPSDVLQEAYIEVSQRLDEYLQDPPMPLFVWFRRIAGQRLFAIFRRQLGAQARDARRDVSLNSLLVPEASSVTLADCMLRARGAGSSPSRAAIDDETRGRLEEGLDRMAPMDREVIVLRHFEQLSNHEIAHALGIEESAASKRYLRALKRLRGILAGMPGGVWEEWK